MFRGLGNNLLLRISDIPDEAGRKTRKRRRRTQTIAKRCAFHTTAKNTFILTWKKENCKMFVFFLIVWIDKTISIIEVIATEKCYIFRKSVEKYSISTLVLKSLVSQMDSRIFMDFHCYNWIVSQSILHPWLWEVVKDGLLTLIWVGGFSLNKSDTVNAITLSFCSIQ